MGKDGGFLTPKAISNRIKAKGLQKLRWYCQMCQKQCRDENGFKCHISSEAHQRQMSLFAENSGRYVAGFSGQFKSDFLKILRISHGTKRVHANVVYQEYIADKHHVHMNATCWNSLNGFVRTCASEGIIILEETEKGPFITWIDKSPETLARQEAIAKKERMAKSEEEQTQKLLEEQIERAKESVVVPETEFTELQKDGDEPLKLKLEFKTAIKPSAQTNASGSVANDGAKSTGEDVKMESTSTVKKPNGFSFGSSNAASSVGGVLKKPSWMSSGKDKEKSKSAVSSATSESGAVGAPKKLSAMQMIMEEEKRKRAMREHGGGFPPAKKVK